MSRRRYRGRRQNRSGMFLVSTVVIVLMLMVSIKCVELKEKQYVVRQEELKQQIADEEARAEELEELKKYVQTDSYVEEIAEEKLGLVHNGEIIFKTTK